MYIFWLGCLFQLTDSDEIEPNVAQYLHFERSPFTINTFYRKKTLIGPDQMY